MIDDIYATYSNDQQPVDVLFVTGDFFRHGLSVRDPAHNNWGKMKVILSDQYRYMTSTFPNSTIISTEGNNDAIEYYQVPGDEAMKQLYYGDLFHVWFSGPDAPRRNREYPKI